VSKVKVNYEGAWAQFAQQEHLTPEQVESFKQYCSLLLEENKVINLTAITTVRGVIRHHFIDSLALGHHYDMSKPLVIADVGTGAGFPALPLKIKYPHLKILLIDMNKKRQGFLQKVCEQLGLEDVEIAQYDWRTFVRITDGKINLFTARASLSTSELSRMFKPSSSYNQADLVYWASDLWQPEQKVSHLVKDEWGYKVGVKKRRLVLLHNRSK